jgi:hypothetical protein
MSENAILMIQAQYTRHLNKSPQYIGKLSKAGELCLARKRGDGAIGLPRCKTTTRKTRYDQETR